MTEPRTFLNGRVTLFHDDCREVLRGMADNSIDSVVCDPPYHLTSIVKRFAKANPDDVERNFVNRKIDGQGGSPFSRSARGFMGKQWDGGDIAFQPELWAEVLRVLKPGGYIMAFSSCRTYHRMACAIEDAGFITHPFFAFAFGSGFPKAHSVSKQIDREAGAKRERLGTKVELGVIHGQGDANKTMHEGYRRPWRDDPDADAHYVTAPATDAARKWDGWFYGTQACKPALEPVYFGQKPFERGLNGAQNVLKWGVGAINVAACRIPISENDPESYMRGERAIHMKRGADESNSVSMPPMDISRSPLGRWPANLIHDGSDEVLACFPETTSGTFSGHRNEPKTNGVYGEFQLQDERGHIGDSGSAARFFASFPQEAVQRKIHRKKSLNENSTVNIVGHATEVAGLAHDDSGSAARYFASFQQDDDAVRRIFYTSKADADDRLGSKHPTVKPLDLIRYLVRLITPKNGVCLDLFAGTGTTGEACFREGFRCILIEREAEYIADIERRMSLVMEGPDTRAYASMKARNRTRDDGPLFGGSDTPEAAE